MQQFDDDAEESALPSAAMEDHQVVWKQRIQAPPSHALAVSGAHLDPMSTAKSGKSFFGRIRVVIRCRPLQQDTEGDHTDNRVYTHGDEVIVCEKNNPSAARSYRFDRVLSSDADQIATFAEVAPLVEHVLDGFHATVFAYGQTGSGKTFTMDGLRYLASPRSKGMTAMVPDAEGTPLEQHGIMPRIIQVLYDRARARQRAAGAGDDGDGGLNVVDTVDEGVEYTFRCSYYQIYNEKITDLLRTTGGSPDPNGNETASEEESGRRNGAARQKRRFDDAGLRVRWQKGDVFKVENLFVCSCASPDEMREMLFTGIQQKVVSSHKMNHQSSRSHCVFTIYVECRSRKNGELRSRSELSLVDLAGSEKIGLLSSNPSAKLVKESIDINTSLLALGKVIMALSSSSSSSGAGTKSLRKAGVSGRSRGPAFGASGAGSAHIPYRDSKLTMLLKHALGGNSLTTMIACISPSDRYVEETTSTLLYAGRAKNIRNAPRVNEDATTTLIRQLREEVAQLKAELSCYREMAVKSLVQPETQLQLCSRCRASTSGAAGAADNGGPRSLRGEPGNETAVTAREAEQLADSLIAACDMLKNMMQVNAELRDSYDAVRDAQDASERREGDLNAENLALRERLAVLESIVLQDDGEMEEDGDDDDGKEEGREVQSGGVAANRAAIEGLEAARQAAEAAAALRANGGGRRAEDAVSPVSSGSPSPLPLRADQPTAPAPTPSPTARSVVSLDPPRRPLADAVRATPVGSSTTTKEELPHVVSEAKVRSPAFGVRHDTSTVGAAAKKKHRSHRTASSTRPERDIGQVRSQGQRRKAHKKKKHRVLARRLKEYEQQYRAPSTTRTYEDYYAQPRKSRSSAMHGVLPIRASSPEVAQTTAALEDMKVTVSKLPKNVVPEYVPVSLLRPGLFGSLAFGGQPEEQTVFEQHRSDRAARLRALQQRQQELYQQVHHAVRDVNNFPTEPPPQEKQRRDFSTSSLVVSQREAVTPKSTVTQRPDSGGEGAGIRTSKGELDVRRASLDTFTAYRPTPPRLPMAAYVEAKATKKNDARPSSDSMTRLMEYLDKGRV